MIRSQIMTGVPERLIQQVIIATVVLGSFMGATDSSIVVISLSTISRYFDASSGQVAWVLVIYLLVITSFLIAIGRLGDAKGQKRIFIAGFVVFTVSSFLCGAAGSLQELVLFRGLQGAGGAMITATGPALLSLTLPGTVRGKALGLLSAANGLGLAAGFGLGAIIVPLLSWQWIFFINVPFGILAVLLGQAAIPADRRHQGAITPQGFDIVGSVLAFLAVGTGIAGLSMGEELGWTSGPIRILLLVSLLLIPVFLLWEWLHPFPLLDLHLLRESRISMGIGAAFLSRLVVSGSVFLLPLYLELVKGYSTGFAGMLLLVPSLLIVVSGPVAGTLSDRLGSRWLCTLAGVFLLLSLLIFAVFDQTIPLALILVALTLRALSMGTFSSPNLRLIFSCSRKDQQGAASGLWYFSRYLGATIGIVVFETLFDHWIRIFVEPGTAGAIHLQRTVTEVLVGFQHAFLVGVLLCVVMILLSLLIGEDGSGEVVNRG